MSEQQNNAPGKPVEKINCWNCGQPRLNSTGACPNCGRLKSKREEKIAASRSKEQSAQLGEVQFKQTAPQRRREHEAAHNEDGTPKAPEPVEAHKEELATGEHPIPLDIVELEPEAAKQIGAKPAEPTPAPQISESPRVFTAEMLSTDINAWRRMHGKTVRVLVTEAENLCMVMLEHEGTIIVVETYRGLPGSPGSQA
jgi:uncharacterized Zn finger protein (UPF0148 family)